MIDHVNRNAHVIRKAHVIHFHGHHSQRINLDVWYVVPAYRVLGAGLSRVEVEQRRYTTVPRDALYSGFSRSSMQHLLLPTASGPTVGRQRQSRASSHKHDPLDPSIIPANSLYPSLCSASAIFIHPPPSRAPVKSQSGRSKTPEVMDQVERVLIPLPSSE